MINPTSRFRVAFGATLIAGAAVLAGCSGPSPETRTTTTEQTTTMTPRPVVSTTTTMQQVQRP
jgi:hypothetical protein